MAARKQHFYGDTLNLFAREDHLMKMYNMFLQLLSRMKYFLMKKPLLYMNASFDKDSKKMVFERTSKSKRGKSWSTIDT
jgi:hypothetical protein